jgi:hypothetical protein
MAAQKHPNDEPPRRQFMKLTPFLTACAVTALVATPAFGQSTASETQRDINQQQRVEQGLKSGALSTREAARLEGEEARVEKMQANALKDGNLTPQEKARIGQAQNKVSQDIYREKHDAQQGDPSSASSRRMQADVQRNINQQRRIEQGVQSGQLTNKEAGKLEGGQTRVSRMESKAGADGSVAPNEQRRIQQSENKQSKHVYREKHDGQKHAGHNRP